MTPERPSRPRTREECLNYADAIDGALHLLDDDESAERLAVLADQWRAEAESATAERPSGATQDAPGAAPGSPSSSTSPNEAPRPYVPGPDEGWADFVARCFHSEYERIAPQFDYATRPDSAVAWENVPETNKRLMRSTVAALIQKGVIELGDAWVAPSGSAESEADQ